MPPPMPIISKPVYVYLQRPDDGAWVTVGRYRAGAPGEGEFRYAPSYVDSALSWSIDPVNLPFVPDVDYKARHYHGLHDVLRDACPDAWGQALLRREHNLPDNAAPLQYLLKAGNLDRWGALAVGSSPKFSGAGLNSPPLPLLDQLVEELAALAERRPPIRPAIRRRLVLQLSKGRFDIARDAVLGDAPRFGFAGQDACAAYLDALLVRIEAAFPHAAHHLDAAWQAALHVRLTHNLTLLRRA